MTAAAGAPIWIEALVRSAIALPFCPAVPDAKSRGRAGRRARGPSAGVRAPPALLGVQGTAPASRYGGNAGRGPPGPARAGPDRLADGTSYPLVMRCNVRPDAAETRSSDSGT